MAHINTGNNYPGILGLLWYKSNTGSALSTFAQTLLHGKSNLTKAERETIASYVSYLNECSFCHDSHAAVAACHWNDEKLIPDTMPDIQGSKLSPKLKALLVIAGKVQKGGKNVQADDVANAKSHGATDEDIHDTVLVAAAFCMFNRYVDGMGTTPATADEYKEMGQRLATKGYKYPPFFLRWLVRRILNKQFAKNSPGKN